MKPPFSIDEFARKVANALPDDTSALRADAQKNLRAVLSATLAKLDLVTREEFDVQSELLARTRTRLEALERQLEELEKKPS